MCNIYSGHDTYFGDENMKQVLMFVCSLLLIVLKFSFFFEILILISSTVCCHSKFKNMTTRLFS